ncbi:VMAP-C domain-containing protein [Acaryochloris marina]|uniref:Trypsin-like peptidase domain-containing protein n=1 Tax=Acaryochloris marina (strain MBIC 11017) TaxID=329726 RepID=A8ZQB3_ACAM1|nr:trypsin-like peptidase domain-containing protein [Acaryochloris marina]ABW33199.1 hypothetical protein AM1_G0019 [Acaryochloris marina MBIC11017]
MTEPAVHPDYRQGIVRIVRVSDDDDKVIEKVIGTGFYLSGRYIITCAHVVKETLHIDTATEFTSVEVAEGRDIYVQFNCIERNADPLATRVVPYSWRLHDEDLVLLKLQVSPPPGVSPSPITPTITSYYDHPFKVFGYPNEDGHWAQGKLSGENDRQWIEMYGEDEQCIRIQPGYSGSPVWDVTLSTIVGMTVATLVEEDSELYDNPESKIGYMIPYRRLLPLIQEIEVQLLLDLLKPHQKAVEDHLQEAYGIYHPISEDPPSALADKLRAAMKAKKLPHLMACLLLPEAQAPETLNQSLRQWFSDRGYDIEQYKFQADQDYKAHSPEDHEDKQPHLLFWVQDQGALYNVQALLIKDAESYNPRKSLGCDRLLAPGQFDEALPYEKLEELLIACLQECSVRGVPANQKLIVELLLPIKLLNKAVEHWQAESAGEDDFLCLPESIGFRTQVVIRAADRLRASQDRKRRDYWYAEWKNYQKLKEKRAENCLSSGDDLPPQQLMARLNTIQQVGLYLTEPPTEMAPKTSWTGVLFSSVAPIAALWPRQKPKNIDCSQECCELLSHPLCELPFQIHCCRSQAHGTDTEDHLGHHLSLMWENPHMIPPKVAQRDPEPDPALTPTIDHPSEV